jgi:undecaprenyl-diphosphatase
MKRNHLLMMTSVLQFALFVPLALWARKHPHPPADVAITHLLQKNQPSFLRRVVMVLNTLIGSAVFLNMLVVPVAVLLWKMRLRLEAVMTIAMSWTNALARAGIKSVIDRPRPNPLLVHVTKPSMGKSFPSGHVASSLNFWGWLFTLGVLQKPWNRTGRRALLSMPLLCVILVGPARIYLGNHWATDVLGGYLFGGGWFCLSLRVYFWLRERGVLRPVQRSSKSS